MGIRCYCKGVIMGLELLAAIALNALIMAVTAILAARSGYRNGVVDGYRCFKDPDCPGHKEALEILQEKGVDVW